MSPRGVTLALILCALLTLGGCRFTSGLLGGASPGLGAWNDTDIPIELVLDGESLGTIEPSAGMEIVSTWRLPPLPWAVEARTERGRVLLTMTVTVEDLASTGRTGSGVDLPCGRFTMWAGTAPVSGPAWTDRRTGPCEP
jgi:hypothetical protein